MLALAPERRREKRLNYLKLKLIYIGNNCSKLLALTDPLGMNTY